MARNLLFYWVMSLRSSQIQNRSRPSADIQMAGQLHDMPSRLLIHRLFQTKFSGSLLLQYRDRRKKIWFSRGEIFKVQSNLIPELLGKMMVDRRWMNEEELRLCLDSQKVLTQSTGAHRKLGEIVQEVHGIDLDEIEALVDQQKVQSIVQSLTWSQGNYEISPAEISVDESEGLKFEEVLKSLQALLGTSANSFKGIFDHLELWNPQSGATELSKTPLWAVLAFCRKKGLSGVINLRRQNRLYEIVLKHGIPLTYYEGSLSQPRQTIIVRRVSPEHEKYFIDQIFKLMSFLTGSLSFRPLEMAHSSDPTLDASLSQFRDDTAITKSIHPAELLQISQEKLRIYKALLRQQLLELSEKIRLSSLRLFRHWKEVFLQSWSRARQKFQKLRAKYFKHQ